MKNHSTIAAIFLVALITFQLLLNNEVSAENFVKGTHFSELSTPINNNQEVREFFSFYCPGCYRHEPIIKTLKASLPINSPLIKNHIDNMPGRDVAIEKALSKAIITAKLLKIEDEITDAIFKYIHVNKGTFSNENDIKKIFLLHDVDSKRFDKTFTSFSVAAAVNKMSKASLTLKKQGITRVPTVIVNGKYLVKTGAIKSKQEYIDLVLYLTSL